MDERLNDVIPIIAKVADGNNLTTEEAKKAFTTIFLYDIDGYHFSVFMSALHAKGETADELLGLVSTYKELATPLNIQAPITKITDLSGTGAGKIKIINVSTLASFVVAAAGYTVAKATYYSVTSPTGSADILAAFGIDIAKLDKTLIEDTLNNIGICPFYTPYFSPRLENRGKLFKKVYKDHAIKVYTTGHIATNAFSPTKLIQRIYGCYSERYLEVLAEFFNKMGYRRTLTFHGEIGIPEISNVGRTIVCEQNTKEIKRYVITAEELGVSEAKVEDIIASDRSQNIIDFVAILKGKEKGAKADLVALNAGASLYSLQDCKSIKDGVKKTKDILSDGAAFLILEKLVKKVGSVEALQKIS